MRRKWRGRDQERQRGSPNLARTVPAESGVFCAQGTAVSEHSDIRAECCLPLLSPNVREVEGACVLLRR